MASVTSRRALSAFVCVAPLAVPLVSCDQPAAPGSGYVSILVTTTGGDTDDRFDITSDTIKVSVFPNSIATLYLPEGPRSFELRGVADNCTVDGSNIASVAISNGDTAHVTFKVDCASTGISIGAQTTGQDFPSAFQILIPSLPTVSVAPNGIQSVSRLQPGRYQVKLRTGFQNCVVAGDSVTTVDVVNRQMTNVVFNVQCVVIPLTGAITFMRYPTIMLMNADGSGIVDLLVGSTPSWSRDGKKIIYSATVCDYYAYNCSGSLATIDVATRETALLSAAQYGWQPVWSPTEDVIAYVYLPTIRIYLLDVVKSVATEVALPPGVILYHPSWSPDGKQLVASCYSGGPSYRICVFNRDGSNLRFYDAGTNPAEPAWSPDGRQIVFTSWAAQPTINLINADGTNLRFVTNGSSPAWAPNSNQIIFTGVNGLYLVNEDGSQVRRLNTGNYSQPSWRP